MSSAPSPWGGSVAPGMVGNWVIGEGSAAKPARDGAAGLWHTDNSK